jgi:hypothetical protein
MDCVTTMLSQAAPHSFRRGDNRQTQNQLLVDHRDHENRHFQLREVRIALDQATAARERAVVAAPYEPGSEDG